MSRRWEPGVRELVFGLVLGAVLTGGGHALLNDPGTLWHLRLGREIVSTGHVPHVDTLTYTRGQAEWVDQSWLFDVLLALVVDHAGWSAAVALSALGLATIYGALAAGLARDGGRPVPVAIVALLAAGVGALHFLIRPHLFTLAFFLATLQLCRSQHLRGGWRVFWAVPITAVWANLHGGFLAGPVVILGAAIGHAVSGTWDAERRRGIARFLIATALCLVAALFNPYGFGLYRHVGNLLVSSGVTDLIDEYQPIPFGKPHTRAIELLVVALIALPSFTKGRMGRYDLVQSLIWLHLSLASVRNVPLFALAVAPGLLSLIDARMKDSPSPETEAGNWSFWPGIVAAGVMLAVLFGARLGGFDPGKWPLAALPTLNRMPVEAPLFHEQDWGGLIEAETSPIRRAFLDDRFELFGREALLKYLNAIEGGPDWNELCARYRPTLVWIRPNRGLARRLENDPAWQVRHRDSLSVLFQRAAPDVAERSGAARPR
jgi:hypothetical protein